MNLTLYLATLYSIYDVKNKNVVLNVTKSIRIHVNYTFMYIFLGFSTHIGLQYLINL